MAATVTQERTLDCRGMSCPMPIVKARKAIDELAVGEVLEVLATDKGAPADFKAWAERTDQKFLSAEQQDGHIRIRLKKVVADTKEKEHLFPHQLTNEELANRLSAGGKRLTVLDVREPEEYAQGHIPGARHLPIESLEEHVGTLSPEEGYAIVCRSGRRSDYACQILEQKGFKHLRNVVPGMTEWKGPVDKA